MKSRKIFRIIGLTLPIVLFFSGVFFVSAFFAHFIVNVQTVDTTLGQLDSSSSDFTVSFNPAFTTQAGNESYHIAPFSHCNQNQYDAYGNCLDPVPNLCPYLSLQPKDGEITETGFTQNPYSSSAIGQLNNPADLTDRWNLAIKSPCFEGECPVDYDETQNGAPIPQPLKGATFKCDLFTETNDVPELVQNYLKNNTAYADNFANSIEVSAVFTGALAGCTVDCFSNVLFLPGLMGSRLYKEGLNCGPGITGSECGDKQLWVSLDDSLQQKLSLNNQGKSIDSVFTKNDTQKLDGDGGETGIVDDVFGFNIYQSFITDLKNWKQDGTIKDYAFIPYDWRLSLDDIITNGSASSNGNLSYNTPQNFSDSFLLKQLDALQKSSKSGKVTIIAHSNGGLVAKALIQKLKDTNNPLYDKIDKVILVAVPQVGTPDAFVSLLHGTELGYGLLMGKDRSRQLAENMPTVYNLLPSASYFTTVDPVFTVDKLVSFENTPFFSPQTSQYGLFVSNETELKNYVLGTDGRTKPSFSDTVHANIGNSVLYTKAESVHSVLDSWQPSPNTKVIQVAGWGEETLAGLDYKSYVVDILGDKDASPKPRFVIDGDATVVTPSALWMSSSNPNVERWWVDLLTFNKPILGIDRDHRDILEIPNLLNLIKSKITDSAFIDPDNILVNNNSTLVSNSIRLHYTLHSPLTLGITDSQGRYTGQDPITKQIREEIPNVTYKQVGNVQFISAPIGLSYTVKMQGYQTGNFSLDLDKQTGNNVTASTSFQGIPSSTSTLATMNVVPNMDIANSILKIDKNGDGTIDQTLPATPDGVTVYDSIPPEVSISFSTTAKDVVFGGIDTSSTTVTNSNTNTKVIDLQGNTSTLNYTKEKKALSIKLSLSNIVRNGTPTTIANTYLQYDWQEQNGLITDLNTTIFLNEDARYVFSYNKAKNMTTVTEKVGKVTQVKIIKGVVTFSIKTELESLKVNY